MKPFELLPGEVLVSENDKEEILNHWNEITTILDKYPDFTEYTGLATTMSRVKTLACHFNEYVKLLHVMGE